MYIIKYLYHISYIHIHCDKRHIEYKEIFSKFLDILDKNNQNLSTGQGTIVTQNSATATITMTGSSSFTSNDRKTRWFVYVGTINGIDFGWFEYKIDAF